MDKSTNRQTNQRADDEGDLDSDLRVLWKRRKEENYKRIAMSVITTWREIGWRMIERLMKGGELEGCYFFEAKK